MELGEKLRLARQEAGLSQRQLCGQMITRNMLSQIEGGKARPSMTTLQYLSSQLGKPVSYFLEEQGTASVNLQVMLQARAAYGKRDFATVLQALKQFQQPDELLQEEYSYLLALATLGRSKQLLEAGQALTAVPLLEQVDRSSLYYREDMERQRRHLLKSGYEALERHYKAVEDYQQAYLYACKIRTLV